MFIMSVNIDCYLEDPRLFKTHQGAIDAMFSILDGYAYSCCGYSRDNVREEVRAIKRSIDSGADAVDKIVDGWIEVYVTQYGASICFPDVNSHANYVDYGKCEVNITNMDEIEVEE
mgnify:FL=1